MLRFQIDLGCDPDDLALHFNPRFNDDLDGTVFVCNSKTAGSWGDEKRETHNLLQKGIDVKVSVYLKRAKVLYSLMSHPYSG